MPTPVVPVSQAVTTLADRPQDGDDAYMDGGAAPLMPVLQNLFDRTEFAKDVLFGHLSWSGDFSVDAGGTNTVFVVRIGAINEIVLYNGTSYVARAYGGGTIGLSKVEGAPANLANSTWYYVYAYNNAGALDFEISTSVPNASRTTKGSSNQRRYIGCFRTDGAGAPLPFRASRGQYVYRRSSFAPPGPLKVLDASVVPVGFTNLSLAALVPPHSRLVTLDADVFGGTGSAFINLRTNGDTADSSLFILGGNGAASGNQHGTVEMETDASQVIQYELALGSGATLIGNIWVMGFLE